MDKRPSWSRERWHPKVSQQSRTLIRNKGGVDYDDVVDYPNEHPIEEFILEVASNVNRPTERAQEWLATLKAEDILTVGDLRDLLEEDWSRINLTVFATRVIKNALCGKPLRPALAAGLDVLSPRVSGRIPPPPSESGIGGALHNL